MRLTLESCVSFVPTGCQPNSMQPPSPFLRGLMAGPRLATVSSAARSLAGHRLASTSTAYKVSHGERLHMTYADYFTTVYGSRKQMRYRDYYAMLERGRHRTRQQSSTPESECNMRMHMRPTREPHTILGVMRGCSKEDLKAAYHRRIWELHPDRKSADERHTAERAFMELSEAYRVLSGADNASSGWPKGRWHFGNRNLKQRATYSSGHSIFVEFMGVTRLKREQTLPHIVRSVLCDRLMPRKMRYSV